MASNTDKVGRGILYVRSKLLEGSIASVERFNTWYDQLHIPELMRLEGIQFATRHISASPRRSNHPYLALYSLANMDVLNSAHFKTIAEQRDVLPGMQYTIFDIAEFEARAYNLLKSLGSASTSIKGAPQSIVCLYASMPTTEHAEEWVQQIYADKLREIADLRRLCLYRCTTEFQQKNNSGDVQPEAQYLAILEFDTDEVSIPNSGYGGADVEHFTLLRWFGHYI
ncbi:hypothetical protein BDV41DRAFT_577925 [Aspergillus transmontanensis]|uniref:EthD domain-containing protein n=1 Tax=Aspergillus transmontanensis TaxID=1034304 RepID=A0A5N6VV33_9EURO|nr:hypothetical protein BDV41DRAFT_577925 [Aspergillus transmontanensis]